MVHSAPEDLLVDNEVRHDEMRDGSSGEAGGVSVKSIGTEGFVGAVGTH